LLKSSVNCTIYVTSPYCKLASSVGAVCVYNMITARHVVGFVRYWRY